MRNKIGKQKSTILNTKHQYLLMCFPAIFTLFLWWNPILKLSFVNWDDPTYITANESLKNLRWNELITQTFAGNFHPLTMISLGMDYWLAGLKPESFHRTNLILHVLNTLLFYILILNIFNKPYVAFAVSILFGVHPLHVESVAWISERKDVLYIFFWLSAAIAWIKFIDSNKATFYSLAIVLFILACLSKAMAVTWVPVMLILYYYRNKQIHKKLIFALTPFAIIAIITGIIAIYAQGEALNKMEIPFFDRFIILNYGLWFYIIKTFIPINLSAFYPYPDTIPMEWYNLPLLTGIAAILLYKYKNKYPFLALGILLFVSMIAPVIQLLPVGEAMVADRYSYGAALGLGLIPVGILYAIYTLKPQLKPILIALFLIWAAYLSWDSRNTISVWSNSITLYENVLKLYPDYSTGHVNMGNALRDKNDYAGAEKSYWKAIVADPNNDLPWNNLGILYSFKNQPYKSIFYYGKAAERRPDFPVNDYNIATAWFNMGKTNPARIAVEKSLKIDPNYPEALHLYGVILQQEKQFDKSIEILQKAITAQPNNERILTDLGNTFFFSGNTDLAISWFQKSIDLKPNHNPEAYNNLAYVFMNIGKQAEAIAHYKTAAAQGHAGAQQYIEQLKAAGQIQ